jgi:biotin carboxyl carrier protein
MRTYLIDTEKNEEIIDLTRTIVHSSELIEFHFSKIEENEMVKAQVVFVRKLAGQYFVSENNRRWKKLARQGMPRKILNIDRVFDVYRGFKPSGLSGGNEGELLTQMPGKIVKILVNEGDTVTQGQPLIILEAMKMENEIKAGVDGLVKAIHVEEGVALDQGVLMLEIES